MEHDVWIVIWVLGFGCSQSKILAWLWWISTDERWLASASESQTFEQHEFFLSVAAII